MKKMIHATGLMIAVLLFSISMSAQERNPENGAKLVTDNMKTKLSLNDDQYQKAYTANLEFLNAAKALKESDGKKLEKAKKLKTLGAERDAKMKAFLSEKQYAEYIVMKEDNKEKLKERRRG